MCGDCRNEEVVVAHAPWRSRFEATVGERLSGVIEYAVHGTWAVLDRIETTETAERADVVSRRLVLTALELLRSRGYRILSDCPSVAAFVAAHPEVAEGVDDFPVGVEIPHPRAAA